MKSNVFIKNLKTTHYSSRYSYTNPQIKMLQASVIISGNNLKCLSKGSKAQVIL